MNEFEFCLLLYKLCKAWKHDKSMERTLVPRLTANHVPSSPRVPKSFDVLTAQYFAAHAYLSSCPSTTLEPFRHTHL